MSRTAQPRGGWPHAAALALLLATAFAYLPVLRCGFVEWDDPAYVLENTHVRAGLTRESVRWAFTSIEHANWHPLTWLSHMADVSLYGLDPAGHHATSLLLHLLNTWLLYVALRRLTGAPWRSLAVAALFALHPLHVESVAWVSERKDVLCATFGLTSLWAYARYAQAPSAGRFALVATALALGLMAKAMLVSVPLVLLLLDGWPLARLPMAAPGARWRLLIEKLPLVALALAVSLVAMLTQSQGGALSETSWPARFAQAVIGYTSYLQKTFWPFDLAAFYPYRPEPAALEVAVRAGVFLAITGICMWAGRTRRYLAVGWAWYVIMLLPVIGLVRIGQQELADRYTYLPLTGVFIALVWGSSELLQRAAPMFRRLVVIVAVLVAAALAWVTWRQATTWTNGVTLWSRVLELGGASSVSHNNYGVALEKAGRLDEAAAQQLEAIRLAPRNVRAHSNLGNVRFAQGRFPEAIAAYEDALQLQPDLALVRDNLGKSHYNIANARWRAGDLPGALSAYEQALAARPDDAGFQRAFALALVRAGRFPEALAAARRAVALAPRDPASHDVLGVALMAIGDRAGAANAMQTCRELGGTPNASVLQKLGAR